MLSRRPRLVLAMSLRLNKICERFWDLFQVRKHELIHHRKRFEWFLSLPNLAKWTPKRSQNYAKFDYECDIFFIPIWIRSGMNFEWMHWISQSKRKRGLSFSTICNLPLKLNQHPNVPSIFKCFSDLFWNQHRFKIDAKAVLEGLWGEVAFLT